MLLVPHTEQNKQKKKYRYIVSAPTCVRLCVWVVFGRSTRYTHTHILTHKLHANLCYAESFALLPHWHLKDALVCVWVRRSERLPHVKHSKWEHKRYDELVVRQRKRGNVNVKLQREIKFAKFKTICICLHSPSLRARDRRTGHIILACTVFCLSFPICGGQQQVMKNANRSCK